VCNAEEIKRCRKQLDSEKEHVKLVRHSAEVWQMGMWKDWWTHWTDRQD